MEYTAFYTELKEMEAGKTLYITSWKKRIDLVTRNFVSVILYTPYTYADRG
jgi:hypothetical protein